MIDFYEAIATGLTEQLKLPHPYRLVVEHVKSVFVNVPIWTIRLNDTPPIKFFLYPEGILDTFGFMYYYDDPDLIKQMQMRLDHLR